MLALARNQSIQAESQVTAKRAALAAYLQSKDEQAEVDASCSLLPAVIDRAVINAMNHPVLLEEHAFIHQQ
jgi:hypothetical protein